MNDDLCPAGTFEKAAALERRFDGPIPAHLSEAPGAATLAQRGALAMLERMLAEYLDEAERLEGRISELGAEAPDLSDDLSIAEARYAACIRSARWAIRAVGEQRQKMGLALHPIAAVTQRLEAAE
jgi:hypothetical protein